MENFKKRLYDYELTEIQQEMELAGYSDSFIFYVCTHFKSLFENAYIENTTALKQLNYYSAVGSITYNADKSQMDLLEHYSDINIFSKILFVVFLFLLFIFERLTPLNALLLFSLSYALTFVIYGCILRPNFSGFYEILRTINLENKRYGIHVYIGRVIDVSTYNIDRLLIGYFIGAKDVGFYGLANSMATPINSLSNAMSSTMFKTLANSSKIPPAVLKANLAWVFLAFVLANILGYLIINFYLKEEYSDVLLLLLLMSIAVCFQALYQPYNAWINGHGYGKELKKANIKMTIMTALSSILLVPTMGAIGACMSSMISNLYSLFLYTKIYYAKI